MRLAMALLAMSACGACEETWPVGTEIHTEVRPGTRPAEIWHGQVQLAMSSWRVKLGEDCPFPYVLVSEPTPESHGIVLDSASSYEGSSESSGYWDDDSAIHVLYRSDVTYTIYTAMHELGHAMSGGWHSDDPRDLMWRDGAGGVTERDVRRMRSALGCAER